MLETYYFFITWASSYCLGRQVRVFIVLSRQNVGCVTRHFQLPSRAQGAAAQKEHKMKDVVKWEASRRKTLSKILKQFPELWGVCQSWSCDYAMQPPLPVVKTIDEVLEKEPSPGCWWVAFSCNEGESGSWLYRDLMKLGLSGSDRTLRQAVFTNLTKDAHRINISPNIRIRYLVWYSKADGEVKQDLVIYKPQSGARFITI